MFDGLILFLLLIIIPLVASLIASHRKHVYLAL